MGRLTTIGDLPGFEFGTGGELSTFTLNWVIKRESNPA